MQGLLSHSAKGTEWKNHKYLKKEDGRYYYPETSTSSRNLTKRYKETSSSSINLKKRPEEMRKKGKLHKLTKDEKDERHNQKVKDTVKKVLNGEFDEIPFLRNKMSQYLSEVEKNHPEIANDREYRKDKAWREYYNNNFR